jgi:solute carrier family 25 folate transporter 32
MLSTASSATGAYPGMLHGLRAIYRTEGLRGYFAGLTPALFGVSHGVLYFGVYERLKAWRRQRGGKEGELTNTDTIFMSSIAKIVAGTATYPHQVVRTRMQNYGASTPTSTSSGKRNIRSLTATIQHIYREESLLAFYKGLGPNLVRVVPSTVVTFLVYENVRSGLPRVWGGGGERREDVV